MNISKAKIAYYLLTFQKSKIPQYLLDVGNNWVVNGLSGSTQEKVKDALNTGRNILAALVKYSWLCPERWRKSYELTISAFAEVVSACSDLKIEVHEIESVAGAFKIAYAEWCAD